MTVSWKVLDGDCRDVLRSLPDRSVHTVVTSPPYFGLRDYGTGEWDGGDPDCSHRREDAVQSGSSTSRSVPARCTMWDMALTETTQARLQEEEKAWLLRYAEELDRTESAVVRIALRDLRARVEHDAASLDPKGTHAASRRTDRRR
jgi:DNA modification methylase